MGCNCRNGANNNFRQQQQRTRANLQSPRRPFIPPPAPPGMGGGGSFNMVPTEPLSPNLQVPPPPDPSVERRRIQQLRKDSINRRFGH